MSKIGKSRNKWLLMKKFKIDSEKRFYIIYLYHFKDCIIVISPHPYFHGTTAEYDLEMILIYNRGFTVTPAFVRIAIS